MVCCRPVGGNEKPVKPTWDSQVVNTSSLLASIVRKFKKLIVENTSEIFRIYVFRKKFEESLLAFRNVNKFFFGKSFRDEIDLGKDVREEISFSFCWRVNLFEWKSVFFFMSAFEVSFFSSKRISLSGNGQSLCFFLYPRGVSEKVFQGRFILLMECLACKSTFGWRKKGNKLTTAIPRANNSWGREIIQLSEMEHRTTNKWWRWSLNFTQIWSFTRLSWRKTVFTLKSIPTVETKADVKESSAYRNRKLVLPTLELPMMRSLNI